MQFEMKAKLAIHTEKLIFCIIGKPSAAYSWVIGFVYFVKTKLDNKTLKTYKSIVQSLQPEMNVGHVKLL